MGMELLSKLPGLVVLNGRCPPTRRQGRNSRSMVEVLIQRSCASTSALIFLSPCLLRTLISSGRKGCRRLEHKRSVASQATRKASTTAAPYCRGRPRLLFCLA